MLLEKQNDPKPKHLGNVGRTVKETSLTHNIENTGMYFYCFISTVNEGNN